MMQGISYHIISSLLPPDINKVSFVSIYIHDPDMELVNRLKDARVLRCAFVAPQQLFLDDKNNYFLWIFLAGVVTLWRFPELMELCGALFFRCFRCLLSLLVCPWSIVCELATLPGVVLYLCSFSSIWSANWLVHGVSLDTPWCFIWTSPEFFSISLSNIFQNALKPSKMNSTPNFTLIPHFLSKFVKSIIVYHKGKFRRGFSDETVGVISNETPCTWSVWRGISNWTWTSGFFCFFF